MNRLSAIQEAADFIGSKWNDSAQIGLILGSGLGDVGDQILQPVRLPYASIPHFPLSTVQGHVGQLILGQLQGQHVLAMQGRFHYYEGYSMQEVVFPVYVMKQLGIKQLIITNACGGINPDYQPGDLVAITDHINFTGDHPLRGPNLDSFGPRFPDMSAAYPPKLIALAEKAAKDLNVTLKKGVYGGISGPSYMTAAELKLLAKLGADLVGMSTVPEVIAANHAGMDVLGISCVTDMAIAEELEPLTHEQVVQVANQTKPKFISLLHQILAEVSL